MKTSIANQRGAALLATLIMLLVVSLVSVNLTDMTNVNKVLVQNDGTRMQTERFAQNVSNQILSSVNNFLDTSSLSIASTYQGFNVAYNIPTCVRSREVEGYSLSAQIVPETTYWTFDVSVTDPLTGASTRLEIGSKFNITAGNCV